MNVLFVSDIYSFQGGNAVSVERISTKLSERGHKITIVTSRNDNIPLSINKKIFQIENSLVTLDRKLNAKLSIPSKREILTILNESKPDVVIICNPTLMGYMFLRYAKKMKIPIVFWNHVIPEQAGVFFKSRFLGNRFAENILYSILLWFQNQTDAVICPTEMSLNMLLERGLKTKGYVISNGVDTNHFKPTEKKPNDFNILYVGRLSVEKNIEELIDAFDGLHLLLRPLHNKPHLYIVGTGCYENNLKRMASTKTSSEYIHFNGYVDDASLVDIYSNSSVFVMPSPMELESISTLEAMASGLPILVANNKLSAARFFVTSWENGGLFNNEDELRLWMLILYGNRERVRQMGEHSRLKAEEHDISITIDKFEELLEGIVNDRTHT